MYALLATEARPGPDVIRDPLYRLYRMPLSAPGYD